MRRVIEERKLKKFYSTVGHRTQNKEYTTDEISKYHDAENKALEVFVNMGDRVLDLGCGEGRQLQIISSRAMFSVGLDYADIALEKAKDKAFENTILLKCDAKRTPFFCEYFDKITCMFNTLGTMPARDEVLKEAYRILLEGGTMLISVYSKEALESQLALYHKAGWLVTNWDDENVYTQEGLISHRFSEEELSKLVFDAGFKKVTIFKLTPISYIIEAIK